MSVIGKKVSSDTVRDLTGLGTSYNVKCTKLGGKSNHRNKIKMKKQI